MLGFPIFRFWAYQMKVIAETRGGHYIWYLRFYSDTTHSSSLIFLLARAFPLPTNQNYCKDFGSCVFYCSILSHLSYVKSSFNRCLRIPLRTPRYRNRLRGSQFFSPKGLSAGCAEPILFQTGPSWSYGSWIYNYLCNQCVSQLTLWVRISLMAKCNRYKIIW